MINIKDLRNTTHVTSTGRKVEFSHTYGTVWIPRAWVHRYPEENAIWGGFKDEEVLAILADDGWWYYYNRQVGVLVPCTVMKEEGLGYIQLFANPDLDD